MRRLYVFAGKGGVGKTILSLAFTKYLLNNKKKNVSYTFFEQNYSSYLCQKLCIPLYQTTLSESIGSYMEKKIGSKIIANAILKTPFFKSLFHIVPGLGYISLLGGLIDILKKNKDLTMVLDPPATGHILTMFSSLHNFKEIFGTGVFAKDIDQINSFLHMKDFFKITVIALPTEMALVEAMELKKSLETYSHNDIDFIVNDSYGHTSELKKTNLPNFLCKKIDLEKNVLKKIDTGTILPHIFSNNIEPIVTRLSLDMEHLV